MRASTSAFTLIEMIGVLAIMSILASVLVPNVLKSIERAAVRAETETLHNIGEQAKLYLRDTRTLPTALNWNTVLATYSSLSPADLLTNRRQGTRYYIVDPVAANERAMVVSSMRAGVAVPFATIAGNFATIWNWDTRAIPLVVPAGWGAWNVDNIEYLVIERINFKSVSNYPVTLKNMTNGALVPGGSVVPAVTASYRITRADGTVVSQDVTAQATTPALLLYAKDRLDLYRAAGTPAASLNFTYVVSTTGKTFVFDGTNWLPQ
jgi:prepilin-type N-terminal cleavage/methylation domain-containing protein